MLPIGRQEKTRAIAVRVTLIFTYAFFLYIFGFGLLYWLGLAAMVMYDSYRQYVLLSKQHTALVKRRMLQSHDFLQIMQAYPSWVNFSEQEKTALFNTLLKQLWSSAKIATEEVSMACVLVG